MAASLADIEPPLDLLTVEQAIGVAAEYNLNFAPDTLANWRSVGRAGERPTPRFFKTRGGSVRYPEPDFRAWCVAEIGPALVRRGVRA